MKNLAVNVLVGTVSFILGVLVTNKDSPGPEIEDAASPKTATDKTKLARRIVAKASAPISEESQPEEAQAPNYFDENEMALMRELEERQKKKWPILHFESPEGRKIAASDLARMGAEALESSKPEYDAFFSSLGLSPEVSDRFLQHIKNIHRASREYEVFQQQILGAKNQFEKDLRASLTPEQYSAYESFEKGKPARKELEKFNSHLAEQFGEELNPSHRDLLQRIIQQHGAFTEEPLHGPYDALPRVSWGKDQTVSRLQEELASLENKSAALLGAVASAGFDQTIQERVRHYYDSKLRQIAGLIKLIPNLPEGPP